jgi:hypothetical protein
MEPLIVRFVVRQTEYTPPVPLASDAPIWRRLTTIALVGIGVLMWGLWHVKMPWLRWLTIGGVAAVALIPPVNRLLAAALDRIRRPSQRSLEYAGLLVGVAATAYLIFTAFAQGRDLIPKTEDDCSYMIGVQMLARGRLWMPQHPLADFFEALYVLVKPAYCSKYFTGTFLAFAPMVWLHWPAWILPVVMSGASVGLLYRIITELVDGAAGAVAAIWMVSLQQFRTLSVMVMSHVPMVLLGLLMIWAWLRWRRNRSVGWAVAIGAFTGWAAITRPADALCYAVPIGLAIAADLWGCAPRRWLATGAAVVLAAAPFLALQIVTDIGVTGHAFQTPYTVALAQEQPGAEYGLRRFNPAWRPASALPEKQAFYEYWSKPLLLDHQPGDVLRSWFGKPRESSESHMQGVVRTTLPFPLLLVLLPAGLIGLSSRPRRLLAVTLPAFILIYFFNPIFVWHYAVVAIPAVILLAFLGIRALANAWPRRGRAIEAVLMAAVVAMALTSCWEIKRFMPTPGERLRDGMMEATFVSQIDESLSMAVDAPAVVLFRRAPNENFFEEPVYNTDVAWPDDAPIIRAHDLGPRNGEIIRYYAQHQPERTFYLFDVAGRSVVQIGKAATLAAELDRGKPVTSLFPPP